MTGCASSNTSPAVAGIISAFGLRGTPLAFCSVSGAWSHRVYKLVTSMGSYAVKQMLDPWNDPDWRLWVEEASLFELAAFEAGVAMPRPVPAVDGGVVADVDSNGGQERLPIRVHEWIEARPCPPAPVDGDVAARLGEDLATMHALQHMPRRREVFPGATTANLDRWPGLVEGFRDQDQDQTLSERVADLTPWIGRMRELFETAESDFGDDPMSHGDVDQKNLLLGADGPVLCDWDVAAPWNHRAELVRTAMSLAGWERPDIARSTIAAYKLSAGEVDEPIVPQDLAVDLVLGVDWLVLCMERATGLRPADEATRRQAQQLVPGLLAETSRHVSIALGITRWLQQ